jgi:hypothetical protein
MSARETQVGGSHYSSMAVQPWDALDAWMTPEELRGYHKGVVIAYLAREKQKGGDQDIRKAAHHLRKLCELLESEPECPIVPAPEFGMARVSQYQINEEKQRDS